MWITCSFLSHKLPISFLKFINFLAKTVNHYEVHVNVHDTELQVLEFIIQYFFHYNALWNLHYIHKDLKPT